MSEINLGPTLETSRLILRPPVPEDIDGWAEFAGDSEVTKFFSGPQPRSQAWRSMAAQVGSWALKGFGMFSVIEKSSGKWIGRIGPWQPDDHPGTEVGWGLTRSAWGKGYAAEAAAASMNWAVDHLGWTDIVHCIDPANINSKKVAERLGSKLLYMGDLKNALQPQIGEIWGQSRDEWLINRAKFK